ncbi:MAG: transcriptional repressor NrdR [Dehalococcoidales bacterium]|nr:MAG: transcriptional repressor NrdR [Dehalococcoidales bacterium]
MNCPYCAYDDSRVLDSRDVDEGIRRRRQCLSCESRFTTYERILPVSLFVMKKDNRRELFDRQKVLNGIRKACEKRPLPADTVDKLADDIESELYRLGRAEVASRLVGDMVMRRLRDLDHIAYIRFASVYREFTDITALKEEVDTLLDNKAQSIPSTAQLPLMPDEELEVVTGQRRRNRR